MLRWLTVSAELLLFSATSKRQNFGETKRPPSKVKVLQQTHPYPNRSGKSPVIKCGDYSCRIIYGTDINKVADLVMFSEVSVNIFKRPPLKPPNQLWGIRVKEPYNHFHANLTPWNGYFNYSAAFDLKSDGSNVVFRSKMVKLVKPTAANYYKRVVNPGRERALWFVSHCPKAVRDVMSGRVAYAMHLSKYLTIDVYTKTIECKKSLGHLVMENRNLKTIHFTFHLRAISVKTI